MGKNIIYTYSCDSCKADFKSPDQVLSLDGNIKDGEDKTIFDGVGNMLGLYCKNCFIDKITGRDKHTCVHRSVENNIVEEKVVVTPDIEYITLRKIETLEDEDTFIEYLGHITRENFNKVYNKSLIGCYYPTEDPCTSTFSEFSNIALIFKAFAGVPQIKMVSAYIVEPNIAYANKSVLMDN